MSLALTLAGGLRHQAWCLRRVLAGLPPAVVPQGSMTLGRDDVELAQGFLARDSAIDDPEPIAAYERAFAAWNGSLDAVSFGAGRVALSAAIYALDLRPGDEVVLPGYTCIVVPNAFHFVGVRTVSCDIELETYGTDVASLRAAITPRTRAILIQHLFGLVCRDYQAILDLARSLGIAVIEDCAHATGAAFQGVKVGNRGDVAFYSSEQSKVLNTTQGGMAVTNRPELARRLREYQSRAAFPSRERTRGLLHTLLLNYHAGADPARWWRADWAALRYGSHRLISTVREEELGQRPAHYGLRLPAQLAVIGLNQLNKLDGFNARRRQTALHWDRWCADHGYAPASVLPESEPVFLRYPVMVEPEKKSDRRWAAHTLNVELGLWFVSQLHPVPGEIPGCPNAIRAVRECINLPTLLS